jgi:hypothetical protein
MEDELLFWKDGDYAAKCGYFIRNNLKEFMQKLIEAGEEPVGIKIDLESFNLEVLVKVAEDENN